MRGAVLVACLLAVTAMTAGCVEIQNPPAAQGTAPAPTVILIERDGSVTTLSQAPTMPGQDSDAARAVSGNSTASSSSTTSSGTPTPEPVPEDQEQAKANTPPEITGFSPSALKGKAPLNVTFRFNARDAEGDPLNYTLHFGDGTPAKSGKFPGTDPYHVYTGVGAKKAVLYIGDGANVTNSSVSITIEPAAATTVFPLQYSATTDMGCAGCDLGSLSCLSVLLRTSGIDCVFFELPAAAAGHSFTAWTDADAAPTFGLWFRDGCSGFFPDLPFFGDGGGEPLEDRITGTVPAGAACVVLYDSSPLGSRLSIDIL